MFIYLIKFELRKEISHKYYSIGNKVENDRNIQSTRANINNSSKFVESSSISKLNILSSFFYFEVVLAHFFNLVI